MQEVLIIQLCVNNLIESVIILVRVASAKMFCQFCMFYMLQIKIEKLRIYDVVWYVAEKVIFSFFNQNLQCCLRPRTKTIVWFQSEGGWSQHVIPFSNHLNMLSFILITSIWIPYQLWLLVFWYVVDLTDVISSEIYKYYRICFRIKVNPLLWNFPQLLAHIN